MENISIKQILDSLVIIDKIKNQSAPVKVAYKIVKLLKILNEEKDNYIKLLQDIIEEYGERNEDGELKTSPDKQSIPIVPEKREECYKKITELEEVMVKIELPSFTLDELEQLEFTIEDLSKIQFLIKE